ncbi:MAG TPA: trypsin-like peptidase domain-containing protein [Gemmatimonadales bacterium]|nr:trypsin-like peptidase domain-containing protein [Gemmatimonadales bacterium]
MKAQFKFLSGARAGQVEAFRKGYIGMGRHPLSDIRFDAERDLDVSSRHAALVRKPEGFVLQDLDSRNGTFVNGTRITGDTLLRDGDVIGFGANGPALEFAVIEAEHDLPATAGAEALGERASAPRELYPAAPRQSTGVRIAVEVARQTAQLRRTTKVLLVLLIIIASGFTWIQIDGRRQARKSAALSQQFQTELQGVREALQASQVETERLKRALAQSSGDAAAVSRLRGELEAAERRQRTLAGAAGVDYRALSHQNQDAVAIVLVEYTDGERFSGTAFSVDSMGTMVTNKHILAGEDGTKTPRRMGIIFSGSTQMWRGELIGVSPDADIGVLRVLIKGGTPRVRGLARTREGIERGDPVAILGYPLGFDLPMEAQGGQPIAEPTLTVGTISKALTSVVQVDAYGAPGSSGSPIFDREGQVIAVLYGGERESNGKIIFAVPAYIVADYLRSLNLPR